MASRRTFPPPNAVNASEGLALGLSTDRCGSGDTPQIRANTTTRPQNLRANTTSLLSSEVSGDEHLLTTNHQRDTAAGDPNRPVARSDGYFRFHLSGTLAYRHYHVDILVNRMSPLTQRLISRVAISVMRICSPRSVMEMAPEISIACWHSRMDIVGGEGGMRGRSASSMMARDFLVSSSWLARGTDISADPVRPLSSEVSGDEPCSPRISAGYCRRRSKSPCGKIRWIFSVSSFKG